MFLMMFLYNDFKIFTIPKQKKKDENRLTNMKMAPNSINNFLAFYTVLNKVLKVASFKKKMDRDD